MFRRLRTMGLFLVSSNSASAMDSHPVTMKWAKSHFFPRNPARLFPASVKIDSSAAMTELSMALRKASITTCRSSSISHLSARSSPTSNFMMFCRASPTVTALLTASLSCSRVEMYSAALFLACAWFLAASAGSCVHPPERCLSNISTTFLPRRRRLTPISPL